MTNFLPGPRETDLPILKHTFDTFIKTINVSFF